MTKKKTALIMGITGMVGTPLATSLIESGWTVYGAARFINKTDIDALVPSGCQPIRFDVTQDDPKILPDVEVLFLEIWDPSNPKLIWPINFYGVGRLVERYAGIADVVNGSTINVYGDSPQAPKEDESCQPNSEYGRSRYAIEKLIDYFSFRGGKRGIHVRYAHANSTDLGVIPWMADCIINNRSLGAKPDAFIQVISLEDFVYVTKKAILYMETPPTAVNCCHPHVWTFRRLAETIQKRLGRGKVLFDRESGGVDNSAYADCTRMIEWFGEPKISFETMLDRVIRQLNKVSINGNTNFS